MVEGEASGRGLVPGMPTMARTMFDPAFEEPAMWDQCFNAAQVSETSRRAGDIVTTERHPEAAERGRLHCLAMALAERSLRVSASCLRRR
eukprot:767529-Hanusia_phi.AAC.3